MKTFTRYTHDNKAIQLVTEVALLLDEDFLCESENLQENISDAVNKFLNKIGLQVSRGKGIVDHLAEFGQGTKEFFLAAIKGDTQKMAELKNQVTRDKLMNFLLKLDFLTLQILTIPIRTIESITGWTIEATINKRKRPVKVVIKSIRDAIEYIKKRAQQLFSGRREASIEKTIERLETLAEPVM